METFKSIVEELIEREGSERKLAMVLGVSNTAVNVWRSGTSFPGDARVVQIAELAGRDHAYMLALVERDRAKSKDMREAWARIAARFKDAAMLAGVAVVAGEPLARATQCVVRSHRERTYSAIVKSLGAPAATTLAQRPGAPACQLLAGSQP